MTDDKRVNAIAVDWNILRMREAEGETPETDAVALNRRDGVRHPELSDTYMAWTDYWALLEHARSLERERNTALAKVEKLTERNVMLSLRAAELDI